LHARLAIVDTDPRAQQPFASADDEISVVFNGEIYNYRDLRKELSSYPFRTQSDTEVLIAIYALHGLDGLKKLRGMFALCIVDVRRRRIYLARDPIGKKPLFLAHWSDGVYFGSTVVAMAAASAASPAVSSRALDAYWELGHARPAQSLVANCVPVLPGEVLELDWEGDCVGRTSCSPGVSSTANVEGVTAVLSRIDALLIQAVQRRLTNNPHPVCLLSGGIDSTVIATHLQRLGGVDAITLGALIPGQLDEKYARQAAGRLGIPLRIVRPRPRRMVDEVIWALDLQDEALGMMAFFPLALMVRCSKDYGRILLTGDGGDEVFLGYGKPSDWVAGEAFHRSERDAGEPYTGDSAPPEWMSAWGRQTVGCGLVGHMFTKLDRATAEQGVEARCPLLDSDLVQYARTLPPSLLFYDGRPKALLKSQLRDWPASFVDRRKIGFAFRLRWLWALSGYSGLRDLVTLDAISTFEASLPQELRRPPTRWSSVAITRHFSAVWKLLAWSRFLRRMTQAAAASS
jgi:asparagine synthase (glutamine-hydrolysing)